MEMLEKITYQDKENNLLILNNILDLLEDGLYKKKNTINDKFDLIFKQPKQFNDEYIKSHYLSIYRAIESVNENRYFVFWEIASGMPQKIITQTIIYDMARFYNTIKHKEKLIDESLRYIVKEINNIIGSIQGLGDYIAPQESFYNSFGFSQLYTPFHTSLIGKAFSIRMALEKKIKWMIFGDLQEYKINLHEVLNKLKENHRQYFDLPSNVDFDKIMLVKNWCNRIIHNGLFPYIWVVWDAIEIIEPLFGISKEGMIDLRGFHYRKDTTQDISEIFL
ncbi:hypothetical protein L8U98_07330 [Campylobacter sp. RKI_CA19_01128]|uniref:hypothetical protein n=1 Tax=unclassified Campylobacter TaxID=2593542 RepID=UPI0021E895ED|nr:MULTISPECIES: hypothetical protein [unclassified Campylobacter]MCV3349640.1 hypothetical protein [Campylobacter sp. RKI_CA19_01127]MCV3355655.1 hypothetical protein [Campylobacter sp. RKI_CA19_01128]HEC1777078.1 hypothetical protein [Campylobacter lari]